MRICERTNLTRERVHTNTFSLAQRKRKRKRLRSERESWNLAYFRFGPIYPKGELRNSAQSSAFSQKQTTLHWKSPSRACNGKGSPDLHPRTARAFGGLELTSNYDLWWSILFRPQPKDRLSPCSPLLLIDRRKSLSCALGLSRSFLAPVL